MSQNYVGSDLVLFQCCFDSVHAALGLFEYCASSNVVGDDIAVHTQTKSFELGLCPELAYHNMITTALWEKSNDKFWQQQMEMDLWIHQILDNL